MSDSSIYTGVWHNHVKGNVMGATLTVSASHGVLLTTFIALFVAWLGVEVWALLSYALHQWRSTYEPRDLLHHQLQALLRTGLMDWKFFWSNLNLAMSWRSKGHSPSPLRRSMPIAILAVTHAVLFAVASIFSSKLANTTGEVLVRPQNCGFLDYRPLSLPNLREDYIAGQNALNVVAHWLMERSSEYSKACYKDDNPSDKSCEDLLRRRLKSNVDLAAPCPFQEGTCITPAVSLDTGYLNSDTDLGISAVRGNRISFRKQLVCAVIDAENYTSGWKTDGIPPIFPWDPDLVGGAAYKYYYLGQQNNFGVSLNWSFVESNYTAGGAKGYTTNVLASFVGDDEFDNFDPMPRLNRTDADVNLWTLRNRASYTSPVGDPFYKATTPKQMGNADTYIADSTMTAIACTEQYSFCNEKSCTTANGLSPITKDVVKDLLGYNPTQLATFNLVWRGLWGARVYFTIYHLQESILLASSTLFGVSRLSVAMPPTQWQTEVRHLFNTTLALLQYHSILVAAPPRLPITANSTLDKYVLPPNTPEALNLCHVQKIRSSSHASFSLFGLLLVLIGGTILIVLSSAIPYFDAKRASKRGDERGEYRRQEWATSDTWNLQKLALDGRGIGPWCEDGDVPLLVSGGKRFALPWLSKSSDGYRPPTENSSKIQLLTMQNERL